MSAEWYEWVIMVFLVSMSGLFSGLNLGLMGLDPMGLEIVISGAAEPDATYARSIKPIRDRGNWLLCTLLLGNVAVNAYLSILLAKVAGGIWGFLISTMLIVIFGEIVPQALCSRYALLIGAKVIHLVRVLMVVIAPMAYPISRILDWALGAELGTIYTNRELTKLMEIHAQRPDTEVDQRAADVLKGVLDLKTRKVRDIMTVMANVFALDESALLGFDVLTEIFKSGHSRIPILSTRHEFHDDDHPNFRYSYHRKGRARTRGVKIIGMLYVKDLILLDPDDKMPVTRLMEAFQHQPPPTVREDFSLDRTLKVFMHRKQHLAVVEKLVSGGNSNRGDIESGRDDSADEMERGTYDDDEKGHGEAVYEIAGIVTLEDVIEHILNAQVVDEHDVYEDRGHNKKTKRLSMIDWNLLNIFDHRRSRQTKLPPQELQAVYHFLTQSVRVFMPQHRLCSESSIKNLLQYSKVIRVVVEDGNDYHESAKKSSANLTARSPGGNVYINRVGRLKRTQRDPYRDIEDNGLLLYQRDTKSNYFSLILDGECEIFAGVQGFRSELHVWSYLCPNALDMVQECHVHQKPITDFVPDFTCKVVETTRVLRISLTNFKACLEGKFEGTALQDMKGKAMTSHISPNVHTRETVNDFPPRSASQPVLGASAHDDVKQNLLTFKERETRPIQTKSTPSQNHLATNAFSGPNHLAMQSSPDLRVNHQSNESHLALSLANRNQFGGGIGGNSIEMGHYTPYGMMMMAAPGMDPQRVQSGSPGAAPVFYMMHLNPAMQPTTPVTSVPTRTTTKTTTTSEKKTDSISSPTRTQEIPLKAKTAKNPVAVPSTSSTLHHVPVQSHSDMADILNEQDLVQAEESSQSNVDK